MYVSIWFLSSCTFACVVWDARSKCIRIEIIRMHLLMHLNACNGLVKRLVIFLTKFISISSYYFGFGVFGWINCIWICFYLWFVLHYLPVEFCRYLLMMIFICSNLNLHHNLNHSVWVLTIILFCVNNISSIKHILSATSHANANIIFN